MCDFSTVAGLLTGASAAIIAACVLIGAAVLANAAIFTSGGSPALMLTAAASCAVACGLLAGAFAAADNFFNCAASTYSGVSACSAGITSFLNDLKALSISMGVQTAACAATAIGAWVPGIGAIGMIAVSVGLGVQIGVIARLLTDFTAVQSCVNAAAHTQLIPGWLVYVIVILLIIVVLTTAVVTFLGVPKWWKMIFGPR